jgi:hypothetical protein
MYRMSWRPVVSNLEIVPESKYSFTSSELTVKPGAMLSAFGVYASVAVVVGRGRKRRAVGRLDAHVGVGERRAHGSVENSNRSFSIIGDQ